MSKEICFRDMVDEMVNCVARFRLMQHHDEIETVEEIDALENGGELRDEIVELFADERAREALEYLLLLDGEDIRGCLASIGSDLINDCEDLPSQVEAQGVAQAVEILRSRRSRKRAKTTSPKKAQVAK